MSCPRDHQHPVDGWQARIVESIDRRAEIMLEPDRFDLRGARLEPVDDPPAWLDC
jgi:hypothetical protein